MDNRSVKRTKGLIKEGFLALLQEKPIQQITVKELTDKIDINRGTFYFHYQDIYGLLESLESDLLEEFRDVVLTICPSPLIALTSVYRFLYDNQVFCRILLGPNGDISFVNQMKQVVVEGFQITVVEKNPQRDFEARAFFDAFIINGFMGIAEIWLRDPKKSPEEMATYTSDFFTASFEAYVG